MNKRDQLLIEITGRLNILLEEKSKNKRAVSTFIQVLRTLDDMDSLAKVILDNSIKALSTGLPLTSSAQYLGLDINCLTTLDLQEGDRKAVKKMLVSTGVEAFGILGDLNYLRIVEERQGLIRINKLDFESEDDIMFKYFEEMKTISPIQLPKEFIEPWVTHTKGYLSIVKKMPKSLKEVYTKENMPKIYNALNSYGSTEFIVNTELLDVVNEMDKGHSDFTPPVIPAAKVSKALESIINFKRVSEFVGDQAKEWYLENVGHILSKGGFSSYQVKGKSNSYKKRKASSWLKGKSTEDLDIIRASSKRYEFNKVKEMANHMQDKSFYYDFQLDSRGRFYPVVNFFEPTGSDLAKGLLLFSTGAKYSENVIYNLAIHTANCMGEDKLSMDDRYLYVLGNMSDILEASEDLLNSEWLLQFKNDKKTKYQLMAAILEWKKFNEEGEDYVCHLPIGLDATNSGLQILSALTRDKLGAQETNVINHPKQEIGDAYMVIANSVLDSGFKHKDFEKLDKKAWRKICKRPTMSYYYDAGQSCIQGQTFEDRRNHGVQELSDMTFDDAVILGSAIYEGVKTAFPKQTQAKDALKSGVKSAIKLSESDSLVTWKTASGFTAFQNYSEVVKFPVRSSFKGKQVKLTCQITNNKAKISNHTRSISANFVHSQDASLLALVISNLADKGVKDFFCIHDQFSVNAEHTGLMLEVFKDTFKSIFVEDQLGNTLKGFGVENNPVDYGDLDLNEISEANYIIS